MGFNCDFNFCLNYKISSLTACLRLNHVSLFIADISSHSLNLQLNITLSLSQIPTQISDKIGYFLEDAPHPLIPPPVF